MSRIAIVTGASQGIGRATAAALAHEGFTVVATSRNVRPDQPSEEGIVRVALDVTKLESVATFAREIRTRYGTPEVVVNNVGRGYYGTLEEFTIEQFQESLEVNFLGALRVTKAFLPDMRRAGRGYLVAVSSMGGVIGFPFNDPYSAAKAALETAYEALHPVAALHGVKVVIVEPGRVTSAHRELAVEPSGTPDPVLAKLRQCLAARSARSPAQSPQDVANVIVTAVMHPLHRFGIRPPIMSPPLLEPSSRIFPVPQ